MALTPCEDEELGQTSLLFERLAGSWSSGRTPLQDFPSVVCQVGHAAGLLGRSSPPIRYHRRQKINSFSSMISEHTRVDNFIQDLVSVPSILFSLMLRLLDTCCNGCWLARAVGGVRGALLVWRQRTFKLSNRASQQGETSSPLTQRQSRARSATNAEAAGDTIGFQERTIYQSVPEIRRGTGRESSCHSVAIPPGVVPQLP